MKAVLFDKSGPELRDVPIPKISDSEVLLAVDACGLCGSDLLKISGKDPGSRILGHEVAGRIEQAGKKVTGFKSGDRVIVAHHVPCLNCHYCKRKSYSMCRQFKSTNLDPGGFCEFVRVSSLHVENTLLRIPDGLDSLTASLTEPIACCLRNVKRLGLAAGDTVGIVGLGSIGLLTGTLIRHFGGTVLGIDLDGSRRATAASMGMTVAPPEETEQRIAELTAGRGLDTVILTAGPPSIVATTLPWLRDGGTIGLFASFHPQSKAEIDLNEIYHRELRLISSYSPSLEDLRDSLALLAGNHLDVASLIGDRFPLADFSEALAQVTSKKILKAILTPAD